MPSINCPYCNWKQEAVIGQPVDCSGCGNGFVAGDVAVPKPLPLPARPQVLSRPVPQSQLPAPVYSYPSQSPMLPQQVTVLNQVTVHTREDRQQARPVDGLSIAGFVCAVVGIIFFCIPLLGGGLGFLGVVFGGIGLSKKHKSGFAVASLTVGLVACLLSIIMFFAYVRASTPREEREGYPNSGQNRY